MNKVELMGRLVADPEVRYSASNNNAVARYTIAVERRFKRDGDQDADFIRCVAFGKSGEFAEKYLHKGMKICVCGRIQTGSYDKDGQKVYTTDVVVENVEFTESKSSSGSDGGFVPADRPSPSQASDGFMNIPGGIDEELPFN